MSQCNASLHILQLYADRYLDALTLRLHMQRAGYVFYRALVEQDLVGVELYFWSEVTCWNKACFGNTFRGKLFCRGSYSVVWYLRFYSCPRSEVIIIYDTHNMTSCTRLPLVDILKDQATCLASFYHSRVRYKTVTLFHQLQTSLITTPTAGCTPTFSVNTTIVWTARKFNDIFSGHTDLLLC